MQAEVVPVVIKNQNFNNFSRLSQKAQVMTTLSRFINIYVHHFIFPGHEMIPPWPHPQKMHLWLTQHYAGEQNNVKSGVRYYIVFIVANNSRF